MGMGRLGEQGVSAAEMMEFPAGERKEWLFAPEVKVTQSCPTLCDPMNYAVHGILQARILKRVAFPFSSGSSQPRNRTQVSCNASGFFLPAEPQGKKSDITQSKENNHDSKQGTTGKGEKMR